MPPSEPARASPPHPPHPSPPTYPKSSNDFVLQAFQTPSSLEKLKAALDQHDAESFAQRVTARYPLTQIDIISQQPRARSALSFHIPPSNRTSSGKIMRVLSRGTSEDHIKTIAELRREAGGSDTEEEDQPGLLPAVELEGEKAEAGKGKKKKNKKKKKKTKGGADAKVEDDKMEVDEVEAGEEEVVEAALEAEAEILEEGEAETKEVENSLDLDQVDTPKTSNFFWKERKDDDEPEQPAEVTPRAPSRVGESGVSIVITPNTPPRTHEALLPSPTLIVTTAPVDARFDMEHTEMGVSAVLPPDSEIKVKLPPGGEEPKIVETAAINAESDVPEVEHVGREGGEDEQEETEEGQEEGEEEGEDGAGHFIDTSAEVTDDKENVPPEPHQTVECVTIPAIRVDVLTPPLSPATTPSDAVREDPSTREVLPLHEILEQWVPPYIPGEHGEVHPVSIAPPNTGVQAPPPSEVSVGPDEVDDEDTVYPLRRAWKMIFSNTGAPVPPSVPRLLPLVALPKSGAEAYSTNLVPLFTATTLDGLCGTYKALRRKIAHTKGRGIEPPEHPFPPGTAGLGVGFLPDDTNFHFFLESVKPMWEDPMCKRGGKIMLSGTPLQMDPLFLDFIFLLAGGAYESDCRPPPGSTSAVVGIVISKRKQHTRLELWLGGLKAPEREWISKVQDMTQAHFPGHKIYPYRSFTDPQGQRKVSTALPGA